ncbi:hypothetical protein B7C62_28110 [Kitasatospora albolonga]|uniref:Terminase small subunit n=1 Tax=Kitasatospora albolonga TaxID=68173 RepID=A0ABC8C5V1_9ACTN|nr:hypothetical protein B7C62_28110 [Kitasatospora albolonga]
MAAELDNLGVTSLAAGRVAVALKLARALDQLDDGDAPTSQAVVADKLDAIMTRLRALAPVKGEGDSVDDITRQREKRRAEARSRATGSD